MLAPPPAVALRVAGMVVGVGVGTEAEDPAEDERVALVGVFVSSLWSLSFETRARPMVSGMALESADFFSGAIHPTTKPDDFLSLLFRSPTQRDYLTEGPRRRVPCGIGITAP